MNDATRNLLRNRQKQIVIEMRNVASERGCIEKKLRELSETLKILQIEYDSIEEDLSSADRSGD